MADIEYKVVYNHELQYSIWPTWKPDPPGWTTEGTKGTKEACLEHIEKVWTDMRPLSLRKWMEENVPKSPQKIEIPTFPSDGVDHFHAARPPNDLVKRLMVSQPVSIIRYVDRETSKPNKSQLLKAAENGYVLVKFPGTKGGTELGANLKNEDQRCQYKTEGDNLILTGRLKLDYTPLLLTATINMNTFEGTGSVQVIEDWKKN